ncbi:MAG TPA: hypothetical protein PKD86_17910, partial [Gemmatales bacterium]|nr:hypothetical protein [Gemmatales bacterium]
MSAAALLVVCPQCQKKYQVPAVVRGKKILCKNCQAQIPVPAAAAAAPAPPPASVNPAQAEAQVEDEWKNFKPYDVIRESDLPRCPFCAAEVEEDQIVCLQCGFNRQSRDRHDYKMYHPLTPADWVRWLGPGVAAVIGLTFLIILAQSVFTHAPYNPHLDYIYFTPEYKAIPVYLFLITLLAIFSLGWFAIKRLVINP